jgi:threonine dehydrogenase-like Zn-dependent dehydrogenase
LGGKNMRAAIFRDGDLVVDTMPEPKPGEGQVVVKTLACGICGSDLHAFHHAPKMVEMAERSGGGFSMDLKKDIVFGHEFCAEILDHGPGTQKTLKPGTRVCSMPIAIGADGLKTVGYSNDVPGGYAEQMVLSEAMLLEVPNGLPTEQAALTEPMAVGWHAVQKANITDDDVALVIGCGPVGLAVIAGLKIAGVSPIIASDFSPARRKLAETMGADIVLDPADTSPYKRWQEEAAPEGYDPKNWMTMMGLGPQLRPGVIFECVGVPGIIQQILEGAPKAARIVVVGVCMEPDRFEPFFAINKELNVQFVLGYTPEEFAETLGFLADGKIEADALVTDKVGVEGVKNAFEELASPEVHAKILVEPWR